MTCKRCGGFIDTAIKNEDGSVTCPGCGTVYRRRPPASQGSDAPRPAAAGAGRAEERKVRQSKSSSVSALATVKAAAGRGKTFWGQFMDVKLGKYPAWAAVLAAVVVLGILFSVFSGGPSGPYAPLYKLEKAFNSQSARQLWNAIDPELRTQFTYSEFENQVGVGLAMMSTGKVKITPISFEQGTDSSIGKVTYKMDVSIMGYSQSQTSSCKVRKVGGTWYISDMSIL
ncbi:MAG: hypothetical protein K5663_10155 [Clostridiales bacterium]|nr:hypothetical protein [Clostridiales bacterium]